MKKGQIYEGLVKSIAFPNKGLVEVKIYKLKRNDQEITPEMMENDWPLKNNINMEKDVQVVIENAVVKGAYPGQIIKFFVNKKRGGRCEGQLKEIVKQSVMEDAVPKCPHFGICGGCSYQTLSYENQTKLKYDMVMDLLKPVIANNTCKYVGITNSPQEFNYRNKMEFTFGDEFKDGPLELGLHKKGSNYDVVPIKKCQIVNDDFNIILNTVVDFFRKKEVTYYHTKTHEGLLRHLLVRRSATTGEITVNLVTSSACNSLDWQEMMKEYVEILLGLHNLEGKIVGITHIENDALGDVVKCDKMNILFGRDYFYEEILGLRFKVSTFSFFQTNSLGAERLYEKAREFVKASVGGDLVALEGKCMFDLYSGTGTIAQMMAPVVGKVVGVEIVEEAVEAARENSKLNELTNCEFIAGDVLKVLDEIEEKPDYIILDPPREGIHPKALEKITDYGVEKMVYISCKPTSLARDLVVFQEKGYRVEKVACVDMFPQTVHVEVVMLLSKSNRKDDSSIKISLDMEEYYEIVDKEVEDGE